MIDDEDQSLLLLRSLPAMYEHLRDTMVYRREYLTMEEVHIALMSKEIYKKNEIEYDG